MSHEGEARLLQQCISDGCEDLSCRRGEIAQALFAGVLHYYEGSAPPPTPTPEPGDSLHVATIEMWSGKKGPNSLVYTEVTIADSSGAPVSDATVSLATTQASPIRPRQSGRLPDGSRAASIRSG